MLWPWPAWLSRERRRGRRISSRAADSQAQRNPCPGCDSILRGYPFEGVGAEQWSGILTPSRDIGDAEPKRTTLVAVEGRNSDPFRPYGAYGHHLYPVEFDGRSVYPQDQPSRVL